MQPCPKPEPRSKVKARAKAREREVIGDVRADVFLRDTACRLAGESSFGACEGGDQWAHMRDHRRSKTRGQPPEERHTTQHSLRLCAKHHADYDQNRIAILPLNDAHGADWLLLFFHHVRRVVLVETVHGCVAFPLGVARACAKLIAELGGDDGSEEGHGPAVDSARRDGVAVRAAR